MLIYIIYGVGDATFKDIYNLLPDGYFVYKWIYGIEHDLDICEYSF